ncbi:hypothetical protein CJF32_00011186 [Rutstroemia sp. NJR-2017a WRK4]|nr:hypothetical protein CJF32_00011186 [Rutstroemia sp. NJR-2017a WRK4]
MAPVNNADHNAVEHSIKNVIQDLYEILVQISSYDISGRPSRDILEASILRLSSSLQSVHRLTQDENRLPIIPPELIQYVDNGRNPDIYTREFVELARKGNQTMKGKMEAFASFRDILAGEMERAMPELGEDIKGVLEATGGKTDTGKEGAGGNKK